VLGVAVATAAVLDSTGAAQVGLATPIVIAPAIAIAIEYIVIVVFMVISSRVRAPGSAANIAPAEGCRRVELFRHLRPSDVKRDRVVMSARRDAMRAQRAALR
jgi:hypothetical protein